MIFALLPLSLWIEILPHLEEQSIYQIVDQNDAWQKATYVLLGSILAFALELSEYLLLTYTSSLTLSIAGIFKVTRWLFEFTFTDRIFLQQLIVLRKYLHYFSLMSTGNLSRHW